MLTGYVACTQFSIRPERLAPKKLSDFLFCPGTTMLQERTSVLFLKLIWLCEETIFLDGRQSLPECPHK